MGFLRQSTMHVFEFTTEQVHAHTEALRADADNLQHIPELPIPQAWPLTDFAQALAAATANANHRATSLSTESNRLAMVMDKMAQAACSVDAATNQRFEAMLP